ncbi:hypothetical protein NEMIN01_1236 [Nematocida minor]|uniref:uncharacterized protein n=1 Tax=Nematocida minor TaxID=1912983 RepID=UPI00221FC597|nr:uncharacterized protein NEMIN01_1236 [Nematocida minor]KAI5190834.1 hypothetical protein NEMIN01_1236 [Nematocida minor]
MECHGNKLIFLKIPKSVTGEVEIREFSNKSAAGSVLLTQDKTYRLVCRENSNTFLMKSEDALSKINMCLECRELKYGEKEIVDILPEVSLVTVKNANLYIPKERVMSLYPMTDAEYSAILHKNRSVWRDVSGALYFAKVETKSVIEVLLLARSLAISKETKDGEEIKKAFVEILPEILFQIVEFYIEDGSIDDARVKQDLIGLFKQVSATEAEFNRSIAINGLV